MRTIADSLNISASTIYIHLVEKIGFKNFVISLDSSHIRQCAAVTASRTRKTVTPRD
jgi:hypothetical protein